MSKLFKARPDLKYEWCIEDNLPLKFDEVSRGSSGKVWWQCRNCKSKWRARIAHRTCMKSNCPYCAGKKVNNTNSLLSMCPDLSLEWNYLKNVKTPSEVCYTSSSFYAWWICKKCNNSWKTIVRNRSKLKSGCPRCHFNKVGVILHNKALKNNNLLNYPELVKDWDWNKNCCSPKDVAAGSCKKVWWKCKECSHEWKSSLNNRTHALSTGCPMCSKSCISKKSQDWLDFLKIPTECRERWINIGSRKFKVDGLDPKNNIVYEFLGDFWHGNPSRYNPEDINPVNKKKYGQLHQEWIERMFILENLGYSVVYIWETNFDKERFK